MNKIFITGISGMIGFHLSLLLKKMNYHVVGIDNYNTYYDVNLKYDRTKILQESGITVLNDDVLRTNKWSDYLNNVDCVIHLAASVGIRHSSENPYEYIENNIVATQKLIDACCKNSINNVIYASTSCVQHGQKLPFKESDNPGMQTSAYGYTKRVNECQFLASQIHKTAGLRFFTVYGPYGRPDMALFDFTKHIFREKEITLFNNGDMKRDFTYVEDIVDGISLVLKKILSDDIHQKYNEIYNIGRGESIDLMDFVRAIEKNVGKKALIKYGEKHFADLKETWADTSEIKKLGYEPKTSIENGVEKFVNWYREYYRGEL